MFILNLFLLSNQYWAVDSVFFERFFKDFEKQTSDYYKLEKLNPAYSVYYGKNDFITIEDSLEKIYLAFEKEIPMIQP